MAKVLVAMGSKSDLDAVKPAVQILKNFGVDVTVKVMSAHRTPDVVHDYSSGKEGDFDVFIAAAGKAAAEILNGKSADEIPVSTITDPDNYYNSTVCAELVLTVPTTITATDVA